MKKWYVIQVYAGYEELIRNDIEKRIDEEGLRETFGQVLVPAARVKQFFATEEDEKSQLFPGYMLIEMESIPEAIRLIQKTPRVTRFLGGTQPVALSQKEIDRILSQMRGEVVISGEVPTFEIGKEVEIKEGPFAGFVGIIDGVDEESEKLTVMVSIFGRMTPVELGFDQIKQ